MSVGERIRQLRSERGLTQEELARACEVTLGQVSKWERGIDEPRIPSLRALSRVFEVSVDQLIANGTGGGA